VAVEVGTERLGTQTTVVEHELSRAVRDPGILLRAVRGRRASNAAKA
jgi:hypothetical protein